MEANASYATPENKLHFLDYWRVIRVRKLVVLSVFLLVVTTTTVVTLWLPKSYSSTVRMNVSKDNTDVDKLSGQSENSGNYDPYFMQTQFEIIQSQGVLYKVIEGLGLNQEWAQRYGYPGPLKTTEAMKLLDKRMDVRQIRNTSLIEIKVFSEVPKEAADIANRIADTYKSNRLEQRFRVSTGGIEKLRKDLEDKQAEVEAARAQVDKLRKDLGITDISFDGSSATMTLEAETARTLDRARIEAMTSYQTARAKWDTLTNLSAVQLPNGLVTVQRDENLALLLQKKSITEQELVKALNDLGEDHPDVKTARDMLKKVTDQIGTTVTGIMRALENQMTSARDLVDRISKELEDAKQRDRDIREKSQPFVQAKNKLESLEKIRNALHLRVEAESVDKELPRTSIVEITDIAEVSPLNKPALPNVPLNVALSVIVGLIAGIGLAFFIEYLDTSVKTIDDIEQALQSPVLGVIPQNVGSLLEEGPESPHSEAYRVLRTQILFSRKDNTKNSITVVSGGAGEGKSTTIFNLATIFAQNGHKVLLVDSDLRRPSLHKIQGINNSPGLTDCLLGKNPLEEVIQTTPQDGLHFLPSGKLPSSSLGILNSPRLRELIQDLKSRYDFVFFDSPPIMGVSDASILTSLMDMTILVVQHRKYPQAMTIRAKQTVDKVGGTLLGVVLNNINIAQDSYYYYYSGYSYDAYSNLNKDDDEPASGKNGSSKGKGTPTDRASQPLKQKY